MAVLIKQGSHLLSYFITRVVLLYTAEMEKRTQCSTAERAPVRQTEAR